MNMGAVAGALGVDGIVGKLANGVNVGGGTTKGQSTTVFSQRYVSVAPMSTLTLQHVELFPDGLNDAYNFGGKRYTMSSMGWTIPAGLACLPITNVTVGGIKTYDENTSPITIGSLVTYSLTEDFAQTNTVQSKLYVQKIIGCVQTGGGANIKFSNLSENVQQSLCISTLIEK